MFQIFCKYPVKILISDNSGVNTEDESPCAVETDSGVQVWGPGEQGGSIQAKW